MTMKIGFPDRWQDEHDETSKGRGLTMTTRSKSIATLFQSILFALILCPPVQAGTIRITDAEAELEDGGTSADVFLTIRNVGGVADRLYAVKTPAAGQILLSSLGEADERKVESRGEDIPRAIAYEVGPGGEFRLHHDGPHISLRQLTGQLNEGDVFTLTLFFEVAGPVEVEVEVEGH